MGRTDREGDRVRRERPAAGALRLLAVTRDAATLPHIPVLLDAAVAALAIRADGTYVDATFGRGGHSARIRAALGPAGRLVALDRDPDAAAAAGRVDDSRFLFRRAWFSGLPAVLDSLHIDFVDGVLFDLGISSPQIDVATRGFSYRQDGPLDMRMDPSRGESAADFIARASTRELTEVIREHGEERFAQSVARAIVAARAHEPVVTTRRLAAVVAQALGARTRGDWSQDPAARTFQALRIHVNRELDELEAALPAACARLRAGGRLAVISFHSLEDRIVKRFIAAHSQPFAGDPALARMPLRAAELPLPPLAAVGRAQKVGADEAAANPRARSAVLRVAARTAAPWPHAPSGARA
ncbi:MAG: 16S rRNA (cytosine(1402)-N(4))-methyltransferase RsmH [Proteobacteria bacterium]|nr:16S rRNA (cytosine(1402)-N(4))-methyltransferase RsmH [Pseudomonadota bacterium]